MKLEITLDEERINDLLQELFAKGCDEVANAIETSYFKQLDKVDEKKEFHDYYKQYGDMVYRALYFKSSKGEITCYYEFWKHNDGAKSTRRFTTRPFIASTGRIYGRPESRSWIQQLINEARENGFEEV